MIFSAFQAEGLSLSSPSQSPSESPSRGMASCLSRVVLRSSLISDKFAMAAMSPGTSSCVGKESAGDGIHPSPPSPSPSLTSESSLSSRSQSEDLTSPPDRLAGWSTGEAGGRRLLGAMRPTPPSADSWNLFGDFSHATSRHGGNQAPETNTLSSEPARDGGESDDAIYDHGNTI
eukprot:GHVT01105100.1.p1 GENE.GHVT01105100.1~~GHVT01105100.1.p1  ORF type:complete len:175 (-),score=27.10 GHVT01105100.1:876-1400(-)